MQNIHLVDRALRFILATMLILFAWTRHVDMTYFPGLILLSTAILGWCPVESLIHQQKMTNTPKPQ